MQYVSNGHMPVQMTQQQIQQMNQQLGQPINSHQQMQHMAHHQMSQHQMQMHMAPPHPHHMQHHQPMHHGSYVTVTAYSDVPIKRPKKAPRAPQTAYTFFMHDALGPLCEKYPNASNHDILNAVHTKWNSMTHDEKQQYLEAAQEDEQRFQEETKEHPPRNRRRKSKKHPKAPKHPMSAYLFFVTENRARVKEEHPNKNFVEIARLLGAQWRDLPAEDRIRYEDLAQNDKERYKLEKEAFHPTALEEDSVEPKRRRKHPQAPKHPLSAYLYFVTMNRPKMHIDYPGKSFSEIARMLGDTWKGLPPHERKKYDILAAVDKKRYQEEKRKWIPPDLGEVDEFPNPTPNLGKRKRPEQPIPIYWSQEGVGDMTDVVIVNHESNKAYVDPLAVPPQQQAVVIDHQAEEEEEHKRPRGRPRKFTHSHEIMSWNSHDIGRFIEHLDMSEHKDKFVRSGISGDMFLKLNSQQLRDQFQIINKDDRNKILKALSQFRHG